MRAPFRARVVPPGGTARCQCHAAFADPWDALAHHDDAEDAQHQPSSWSIPAGWLTHYDVLTLPALFDAIRAERDAEQLAVLRDDPRGFGDGLGA